MVVNAPFLRWDIIRNSSIISKTRAHYYFETAQGEQVIAALQVRGENNQLVYKPFDQFIEDYQTILNLGDVTTRSYGFQLGAWLDDIVYHLFVRYSEQGIPAITVLFQLFTDAMCLLVLLFRFMLIFFHPELSICFSAKFQQVLDSAGIWRTFPCPLFLMLVVALFSHFIIQFTWAQTISQ